MIKRRVWPLSEHSQQKLFASQAVDTFNGSEQEKRHHKEWR